MVGVPKVMRFRVAHLVVLIGAAFAAAPAARACEVVESLPDAAEMADAKTGDAATDASRWGLSPEVATFVHYVGESYLAPRGLSFVGLPLAERAKLIGYAIGEAAIRPPSAVDVFAPGFKADLERYVGLFGVSAWGPFGDTSPAVTEQMWRLIEESARGFYDEEMRARFGSVVDVPTSVEAWFEGLSEAEKASVLANAAKTGVARENGAPYTAGEFKAVSILLDGEFNRQNYPAERRRAMIRDLAAGKAIASTE